MIDFDELRNEYNLLCRQNKDSVDNESVIDGDDFSDSDDEKFLKNFQSNIMYIFIGAVSKSFSRNS